ncbi:hypothetical protein D4740_03000 [Actinomyces sp. 2119]|uniref:hypothetical protein n=1 Tax=Actinomyces sp. 2119 TaxID=2321393 RepID=UPI000E6B8753|nr:hypothetical protein [Actinomyces sp. 2119]RJF43929.1 hypothetical protein D4740_03000 [Actinomyces sp. 2119]
MSHPLSPDSAFRGLARAVLQVALTGSRHIVAGLVTIVAGILAVAAGLLRVALGIPAALITAVARFAVAASKRLAPGWGWWAVGGICTIAVACGLWSVHELIPAASLFLCFCAVPCSLAASG